MDPKDTKIGVIDSVWLGLMPKTINAIIKKHICILSKDTVDRDAGINWKRNMSQNWKEIISLNTGRSIGIHRIINGIGTKVEEELIQAFSLHDLVQQSRTRKISRAKRTSVSSLQTPAK